MTFSDTTITASLVTRMIVDSSAVLAVLLGE